MKNGLELTTEELANVNGGVVFLIPPAVGFAAKVTGISLGIITSGTITMLGLTSAYHGIFGAEE